MTRSASRGSTEYDRLRLTDCRACARADSEHLHGLEGRHHAREVGVKGPPQRKRRRGAVERVVDLRLVAVDVLMIASQASQELVDVADAKFAV